MKLLKILENEIPSKTYLKDQLIYMKNQVQRFFRTTTEIQSGLDSLDESRSVVTFLPQLGIQ